jgi:hypothetical protein
MDTILIQLFQKSCALSFTDGWVCGKVPSLYTDKVSSLPQASESPFDYYILFSLGYLVQNFRNLLTKIALVLVLPLSILKLGQNITAQLISAVALICVFIIWVFTFVHHGLNNPVPVIGDDESQLVGFVISNFAFV